MVVDACTRVQVGFMGAAIKLMLQTGASPDAGVPLVPRDDTWELMLRTCSRSTHPRAADVAALVVEKIRAQRAETGEMSETLRAATEECEAAFENVQSDSKKE